MVTETQKRNKLLALNCPMPKVDFDVITMGHGSGGILTHRLLETGVFNLFKNEKLNQQHDGAVLNLNGRVGFTTDSYVVKPIFFPGGDIGDLAVNGSVNDLAMCGAIPEYLSLSFILEEGLAMKEFWEILLSIKAASEEAGVTIVTGDTKVVERGKGDKIFINTSALGNIHPEANIHASRVKAGDKILLSGSLANHGMAILSVREGLQFETSITSDTQPVHRQVKQLLDALGSDVHFLRDPTRGGLATVLNEVAELSQTGVEIFQNSIPVSEEVEGACEMLGLDPLFVANEGIFIAIIPPHQEQQALSILKQFDGNACSIGLVTQTHARQVIQHSGVGGRRIVTMLPGEQLPRIC